MNVRLSDIYRPLWEAFNAGNRARKKESIQDAVQDMAFDVTDYANMVFHVALVTYYNGNKNGTLEIYEDSNKRRCTGVPEDIQDLMERSGLDEVNTIDGDKFMAVLIPDNYIQNGSFSNWFFGKTFAYEMDDIYKTSENYRYDDNTGRFMTFEEFEEKYGEDDVYDRWNETDPSENYMYWPTVSAYIYKARDLYRNPRELAGMFKKFLDEYGCDTYFILTDTFMIWPDSLGRQK